jgi:60 kDa SS-A/Ro ribonucleoprotein
MKNLTAISGMEVKMNYSKAVPNTKTKRAKTPQSKPIPGKEQIMTANSAGGYSFKLDNWSKLNRFLILGTEGGTYYIQEKDLTKQNVDNVMACIKENSQRVLDQVLTVSTNNRAAKNDMAIFVLALIFVHGSAETKASAGQALPLVCRTGTHLFMFTYYVNEMRSLGRSIRKAISNWYAMDINKLEYQICKYQSRQVEKSGNAWTHKDVIRMAHVKPAGAGHDALFRYLTKADHGIDDIVSKEFKLIDAMKRLGAETDIKKAVKIITDFKLTHEMIPTELKNDARVWDALLPNMPLTAMIRNLNKMTSLGLLTGTSTQKADVVARLNDPDLIKNSRIHPMQVLNAYKVYSQGKGIKGSLSWNPVQQVVDALDQAFYLSFGNVVPTHKNICLALDLSASMTWAGPAGSVLDCRETAAAMALITMNTEPNHEILGFTSAGYGKEGISKLAISANMRLGDVIKYIDQQNAGGTDCALPMLWATKNKQAFDAFCVYTDNETWHGSIHPSQALIQHRKAFNNDAKLIVVGMQANDFSIADPKDKGMLDVVGFDSSTPNIMSEFISGSF